MIELHSVIQQRLLQIIPFPFKVLLCLVVMHFTANSHSFEILCLFLISLSWEAALLHSYTAYFCFTAKLPLGMLIHQLAHRSNCSGTAIFLYTFKNIYNLLNPYVVTKWTVFRSKCSYRNEMNPDIFYISITDERYSDLSFPVLDLDIWSSRGAAGLPACQRGRVRMTFGFDLVHKVPHKTPATGIKQNIGGTEIHAQHV